MKLLSAVKCLLGISVTSAFRICDISEYNPHGDGVNYDDAALQAALNDCKDGGQIYFNSGKYLLSPFNMSSNMELYLNEGVTLFATSEFDMWPVVEELPSYPPQVLSL
jgi:polygalacturonase